MKCNRVDCDREATYQVGFKVFPKEGDVGADAYMGLYVCDEHGKDTTIDNIVTDDGWAKIQDTFRQLDRAIPVKERTKVELRPLSFYY